MSVNPLSIAEAIEANGEEPLGDTAQDTLVTMLNVLDWLTQRQRAVVFQVLTDFFCPHCGIDQPEGDCQCQRPQG